MRPNDYMNLPPVFTWYPYSHIDLSFINGYLSAIAHFFDLNMEWDRSEFTFIEIPKMNGQNFVQSLNSHLSQFERKEDVHKEYKISWDDLVCEVNWINTLQRILADLTNEKFNHLEVSPTITIRFNKYLVNYLTQYFGPSLIAVYKRIDPGLDFWYAKDIKFPWDNCETTEMMFETANNIYILTFGFHS
jgi:hypothetical protein